MMISASDLLMEAASVMEERGLTSGNFLDSTNGKVCLEGAVRVVLAREGLLATATGISTGDDTYTLLDHAVVAISRVLPESNDCYYSSLAYAESEMKRHSDGNAHMRRVYIYNDTMCDGSVEAAEILRQASKKASE